MTDKPNEMTSRVRQDVQMTNHLRVTIRAEDLPLPNGRYAQRITNVSHERGHAVIDLELGEFLEVPVVSGLPDQNLVFSSAHPMVQKMEPRGIYMFTYHGEHMEAAHRFMSAMGKLLSDRWPTPEDMPTILVMKVGTTNVTGLGRGWSCQEVDGGVCVKGPADTSIGPVDPATAARVRLAMAILDVLESSDVNVAAAVRSACESDGELSRGELPQ